MHGNRRLVRKCNGARVRKLVADKDHSCFSDGILYSPLFRSFLTKGQEFIRPII